MSLEGQESKVDAVDAANKEAAMEGTEKIKFWSVKVEWSDDPNQTKNNDNPNKTGTSETKTEEQEKREISEEEANAIVEKANQFDMKLSPENIIRQDESWIWVRMSEWWSNSLLSFSKDGSLARVRVTDGGGNHIVTWFNKKGEHTSDPQTWKWTKEWEN